MQLLGRDHEGAVVLGTSAVFADRVVLEPGESFANHYHEHHEELFVILAGHARVWIDQTAHYDLGPGDVALCVRGEQHLFQNAGDAPVEYCYIKSPNLPEDRVVVDWVPPAT